MDRAGVHASAGEAVPSACLRLLRRRRRGELATLAPPSGADAQSCPHPVFHRSITMHTHTSPDRAPTARTAVAALVAAAACWGTGTVASKQVVDDVAPLTLLPMQLAASCVLLLVVTLVRKEPLRLDPAGPPAGRPGRPQPGYRLRPRTHRTDHHHRQHVRAALGAGTGGHHAARRPRPPRARPAPARGRGGRGHRRGAARRLPARRHRRHHRHHPHRGLDRVLRPVLGADPADAAGRLGADRGARPAGRRPALRGRPGVGRRRRRRHGVGT